jgi:hypothetical protein
MFPIKNCKPDDWNTSEKYVVTLVQNVIINSSAAEETIPTKHPNWYDVEYIFVEHIGNQISVSSISFSTVTEKQVLKHFKLAY